VLQWQFFTVFDPAQRHLWRWRLLGPGASLVLESTATFSTLSAALSDAQTSGFTNEHP
jgi:hypothetical protein